MSDFKIGCTAMLPEPRVIKLPDGRVFRLHGVNRVQNRLTRKWFSSAIYDWKLAGRWIRSKLINSKMAIKIAEHWENYSEWEVAATDANLTD